MALFACQCIPVSCEIGRHSRDTNDAEAGCQYVGDDAALFQADATKSKRLASRTASKNSLAGSGFESVGRSASKGSLASRRKKKIYKKAGSLPYMSNRSTPLDRDDLQMSEALKVQLGINEEGESKDSTGYQGPGSKRRGAIMFTLRSRMNAFRRRIAVVPKPNDTELARGIQIEGVYDFWTFEGKQVRTRKMNKDVYHDRTYADFESDSGRESSGNSSRSETRLGTESDPDIDNSESSFDPSPSIRTKSPIIPPRRRRKSLTDALSPSQMAALRNTESATNWGTIVGKVMHMKVLDFSSVIDKMVGHHVHRGFQASFNAMFKERRTILNSVRERAHVVAMRAREISRRIIKEPSDHFDCEWDEPDLLVQLFSTEYFDTLALFANTTRKILSVQPSLVEVPVPCRIFGDLHGQFRDLLLLFHAFGGPDEKHAPMFVFNGDFVDRGAHQLEVIGLLFALKTLLPERVWLIRGNHEDRQMNKKYGFLDECHRRLGFHYGTKIFDLAQKAFDMLPVACLIANRVLVVHGGIGDGTFEVGDVRNIKRPLLGEDIMSDQFLSDLLWSDPIEDDDQTVEDVFGVHQSPRGGRTARFGWNVSKTFCARNGLSLIVRSHQSKRGSPGFDIMHESLLMRVFSARDYEGHRNDGAVLLIQASRHDGKDVLMVRPQVLRSTAKAKEELARRAKDRYESVAESSQPPEIKKEIKSSHSAGNEEAKKVTNRNSSLSALDLKKMMEKVRPYSSA